MERVEIGTAEWHRVEFRLQLTTGKPGVRLHGVKRVGTEGREGSVDGVVNLTEFSKDYCGRVIRKSLPMEDILFYCGHLDLHQFSQQPTKVFTVLLVKVWLGRIGKQETPVWDSLLVSGEGEAFQYNFILKSNSQYSPQYEVTFALDGEQQFRLNQLRCSACDNRPPSLYCRQERLHFCSQCSQEHHKGRVLQNHALQRSDRLNALGSCQTHNYPLESMCLTCFRYLCTGCLQKGLHCDNWEHPCKPIAFLYEEHKQSIEAQPQRHLDKLQSLARTLEDKINEIGLNYGDVKRQLEEKHHSSKEALQSLFSEKKTALESQEIELKLLKDKILWAKAFLKFQQSHLKPMYFLKSAHLYGTTMQI